MTVAFQRLVLAATTGLALLAGQAQAADLRRPAPMPGPMAEAQPVYPTLWTGLYVGGHVGYGWGNADGDFANAFLPSAGSYSNDIDGVLGGVQIGYNWQALNWVYGLEADFAWSGIDGSSSGGDGFSTFSTQLNWMSTFRGKIGFAQDRWMVYATGGAALADFDVDSTDGVVAVSDSATKWGWTVGAGLDYALTDAWRLGVEYKYADFGSETFAAPFGSTDVDLNVHSVSLRVNYRF